jgi:glycosyltransferase involved in cell wall biosynthesis
MMKITVVIPAYNCEKWISRAIESVLQQSRPADEVIVVDDGSTDSTAEMVRSFGDQVTLIQQENAGVSAARNAGIEAASGDWIAFLDSDDEWMPDYLKRQCELLERNPELVWSTANFSFCYCDENKRVEKLASAKGRKSLGGKDYFEDYCKAYVHYACGCTDTMIVKKQVLTEAGLFRPGLPMGEDQDMWFRVGFLHPEIGYVSDPQAVYHIQIADSATQKYTSPDFVSDLLSRQLQMARQYNCLERFEPCARQILRFYLGKYLHDDRIRSISVLLKKYGYLLPRKTRFLLRTISLWPQASAFFMPMISRINKHLGLRI